MMMVLLLEVKCEGEEVVGRVMIVEHAHDIGEATAER
jgi:hypothetical protein